MSVNEATGQHYVECDNCTNYSRFYCNTCHLRLCEQCREAHLRETDNRNHGVVLYKDRLIKLPIEKCLKHPTRVLELYCVDCPASICSKCFTTDHTGHQVQDLEVVYNQIQQLCQQNITTIRYTFLSLWEERLVSQREREEEFRKEILKLRLCMKQSADEIKSTVDTILFDNNAKLDEMEASILGEIANQKKKSEDYISYLEQLIKEYSSNLTCKPSEFVTFSKEKSNIILQTFPEIIEPCLPALRKRKIKKSEIEKLFGGITQWLEHINDSSRPFNSNMSKPSPMPSMELSSLVKVYDVNLSGLDKTTHLSSVPHGKFWASDERHLIHFDKQGNILQKITIRGQEDGFHSVTKKQELIYTDCEKKTIYKVIGNITVGLVDTKEWKPWSIFSSHYNGDLLVGMKKDKEWKITRYNREGMKLHDIQRNDKEEDMYASVSYITENINGDICTTDPTARKMVVVTKTGTFRFSYSGSAFGRNNRPHSYLSGVCTDVLGNILVCACLRGGIFHGLVFFLVAQEHFGIHLLNCDGHFLSLILPFRPHLRNSRVSLCIDEKHNLMVGSEESPEVSVYKYLQSKGMS